MTPVQTPADLKPITALRFAAALWVAVYAFWENLAGVGLPGLVAKGYLGVELFFVLSGFILSHVYLAQAGEKRFSYGRFLWARVARVYPLHIATLLGVGLLAGAAIVAGMSVDSNVLSWSSLPANLLMVHAWGLAPAAGWNHPSWSISAEWFAYLCFPAFAFVFWRLRDKPVVAVLGAAAFLAVLYFVFEQWAGFPLTEATIRWGALRIVPCFALGCALYLVYRKAPLKAPGLSAAIFLALMLASAALGLWDAITVLLAGGLILSLASLPNARAGWLASRPAVYLGEISYSVYMVCVPWKLLAVNLAAKATDAPDKQLHVFVWLAIVALLPVVAAVSYHLVEHPARKALRGWGERRNKTSATNTKDADTSKGLAPGGEPVA
ncbi:acyltransferase [Brevundimonas albigilva]|uniref:Acyltransferase n=3 Tax=Brevundimonas TaxID=41275 RepID=A0ABY4SNJ1_9CAUL|nr:acyltransferase [Brevundimonas albigilva]UQV17072.1 acyltransferase [Brevundimonas albigilva]URI15286.1 acyltransferase [Brevundimonas albigilva]